MRRLVFVGCLLWASHLHAQEPASYTKHVRPFLAKYCVECHNLKAFKAGLDLDTYKSIFEGSDRGAVVVPGKPAESRLVTLLDAKSQPAMPPKSVKIRPTPEEIARVRAWIAAGAKDDGAAVKVVIPDIKPRRAFPAPVSAVVFRQGTLLAAGYRQVTLIDPERGDVTSKMDGFIGPVTALATHGDLIAIAAGAPGGPGELRVQRDKVNIFTAQAPHTDSILALAFSPDGKTLASSSYDSRIKLWDIASGKELFTLKEHSDSVYAVAFNRDGTLLASCAADRAVKLWDVPTGKLLYTLGEANDWVYTLAFSPTENRLACGGVDKSIRVYDVAPTAGKLVHSVFAHQAAVQKIVYTPDGKGLYSVGQDRILKSWDAARMVETKTYPAQPEAVLSLALDITGKRLALGRHDGVVVLINPGTGKTVHEIARETMPQLGATRFVSFQDKSDVTSVKEQEPNNSPGQGQKITLPATVFGSLEKAGEMDFYRFEAAAGYQLGVHLIPQATKDAKDPKLEPVLQLFDGQGRLLAENNEAFLGYTFPAKGTYALGIHDRDFRGGTGMSYRLRLGDIPVIRAVFPLGAQRGTETTFRVEGVNLPTDKVVLKIPADATPGSKLSLGLKGPLGNQQVVVGEFVDVSKADIPVPATANGRLLEAGESDTWSFAGKKGQKLIVEVEARRLGSPLDSMIEILDEKDQPIERAVLRCQAKTHVTFRDHDSAQAGIRIEAWGELATNDLIYVGSELMKIKSLPTHPDADCNFFAESGQRLGFLDTTPTHHPAGVPMYKVSVHPPGSTFAPNGFPVFTMHYRNDDGGPGIGRDSRLFFDPPADGKYRVRIQDSRGLGGVNFGYRLTVREPRPSFNVRFTPTSPEVARGGAVPLTITAERIDGYRGPIHVDFANVPPGFHLPATTILPEEATTAVALYAEPNAKVPAKMSPLKMRAHAEIAGQKVIKEITGETFKVTEPNEIMAFTEQEEITLKPGGQVKLTLHIDRRNGFLGRVPLEVRGLPHGVRVLDIGLNGILITEREVRRTMVLYAEPWVEPILHPIVVLAKREGKTSEHAAKSVTLRIAR